MIPPAAAQAIKDRLRTGFTAAPIAWPNEKFDRPVDKASKRVLPFVKAELAGEEFDQASIGAGTSGNLFRTEGRLSVHIFVAANTGDDVALQMAKQIRDLYCGQEIAGVEFRKARVYPGADGDESGVYWRRSIVIEFRFDEVGLS